MGGFDLTDEQTQLLDVLVTRYQAADEWVKGETLAAELGWDIGRIRSQMQSLEALQLAEGVPGPKGGYKPTLVAYETLDRAQIDEPAITPVYHEQTRDEAANVQQIRLSSVHDPDRCTAEVTLSGADSDFDRGDDVVVGPTPCTSLVIYGQVIEPLGRDNRFVMSISNMEAPAGGPDF
jgi:hypothetical protein